jgi:Integrase zinc binding domain
MEEFRETYALDPDCVRWKTAITGGRPLFDLNYQVLLIRIAPINGSDQVVLPRTLVPRLLHTTHYPPVSGHPGAHRMFATLRRQFFWPRLAMDVYEAVLQCDSCA